MGVFFYFNPVTLLTCLNKKHEEKAIMWPNGNGKHFKIKAYMQNL